MSAQKRFLIAGCGALAPLLVNLALLDAQSLATFGVTFLVVGFYVVRQITLFVIGGLFGYFNQEDNAWKLFQLGVAAPALLTAMINAKQVGVPQVSQPAAPSGPTALNRLNDLIVPPVFADTTLPDGTKVFTLPQESAGQQINRGLFGTIPSNVWYVVAGSFPRKEDAVSLAAGIRLKGFPADVYQPYGKNPYFEVVIGAQLTLNDAQALRAKAIAAGLPSDTHLWTFPNS